MIVALLGFSQSSWGERLGFKSITLGSPLARVASDPRHECRSVRTPIADTACSLRPRESETIAGANILMLLYFFDAGYLSGIQITLLEKDFQAVVDALAAKYGPGVLRSETVKSLDGTGYENRHWSWTRSQDSLWALRYSGRLDRSEIRFTDMGVESSVKKRRSVKDPTKDL